MYNVTDATSTFLYDDETHTHTRTHKHEVTHILALFFPLTHTHTCADDERV